MPPKDDHQRADLQHQQQPQSTTTSSPTSPASFFVHLPPNNSSEGAQPQDERQQLQPFLELETPPTAVQAVKLPSFRLLPRNPSSDYSESQEVPAFLAYLHQLHGTPASSSQASLASFEDEPSSMATQFGSSTSSSASSSVTAAPVERRHVRFAEQPPQIHPTLRRIDYSASERNNTWYTDRYLRVSSQMHAMEDDKEDTMHLPGHKRDLILAAARIRRARQAVMKEQARTPYLSLGARQQKEERIREAYHRVTLQCQRDAKGRGEEAAKVAAAVRES